MENKNGTKNINYGLLILKSLLAFSVISTHCFKKCTTNNRIILKITKDNRLHVPSFVIMSFYFTHKTIKSPDINVKYKRFERLLIPYLGWPIINYIINNILYYSAKLKNKCSFKNLLVQIIIGQAHNMPFHFWYILDLMITYYFMLIVLIISKDRYLLFFQAFMIFTYFFQYSGFNNKLFLLSNKKRAIGREGEFLPFAFTGFLLKEFNIINMLKQHKLNTFIISVLIYNLIREFKIFSNFKGIAYGGMKLNILSVCNIFIFSLISFGSINNKYMISFVKTITNFTGGIFYLHSFIHYYFKYIIMHIKKGTFFSLILIYFFCYIICFFGIMIFGKTKIKYLFS